MSTRLIVFCSLFLFNIFLLSDEEQEKTCEIFEKKETEFKKYIEICGEDGKKCYCSNHAKIINAEKVRQSAKNKLAKKHSQKKCEIEPLDKWKDSEFCYSEEGCSSYDVAIPEECRKNITKENYNNRSGLIRQWCEPVNNCNSLDDFFKLENPDLLKKSCSKYGEKKESLCNDFNNELNKKTEKELSDAKPAVTGLCDEKIKENFTKEEKERCDLCNDFKEKIESLTLDEYNDDNLQNAKLCGKDEIFHTNRRTLEIICSEVKDIANLDLEKFEKLKKQEEYSKCPHYSLSIVPVFEKCATVERNLEDKNREGLENLLNEIDFPVCKEIFKKRIDLLKNNEECENRRKKFFDTMKEMKKFNRPTYNDVYNPLSECAENSEKIKTLLVDSNEYIKRYIDEKKFQKLKIDIEYLKVPKYKAPTLLSICRPGETNPNAYIEIQCSGDGCNSENIKTINSKLEKKACKDEVVFEKKTTETITLEWSPDTRYTIKIMDKYLFPGCSDKKLAEMVLQTDQICGYKNFKPESPLSPEDPKELDDNIEIKIEQRLESKEDGMDCPWDKKTQIQDSKINQ